VPASLRLRLPQDTADEEPTLPRTAVLNLLFILLAFFVSSSELRRVRLAKVEPVLVAVDARDEVFVGGERAATEADLGRMLDGVAARSGKDAPVRLASDPQARGGTVVRVMAQLSRAGLTRIQLAPQERR
jgi:biopolymer transport protein ExbD